MADTEGTAPTTTAEEAVEQDQQQQEKDEEVAQETAAENGEVVAESAPKEGEGEEKVEQEENGEGEEKAEQEEKGETEETQQEKEAAEQGEETAAAPEEQGETTEETQEEQNTVAAPESEQQNATGEQDEQEADVEEQKEQEEEEKEEEEEEKEAQEEEEPLREENGIQENGVSGEENGGVTEETEDAAACEISEKDKEKCLMMFEKKAVNGRLDLKGFKVLFRLMGEVLSSADADSMFQDGARDDQDTIDFAEFCRLYMKFREAEQERKSALATSIEKLFPTADDQPVELKKVESLLLKLQQPDLSLSLVREKSDLGQDDVRRLVKAMDKHGNGLISKTEFVDTLCDHLKM